MSEFVGKYVCYGNDEGMFCWGKIAAEVKVNTPEGEKGAFILENRMSGPHKEGGERIRRWSTPTIIRRDFFDEFTDDDLFLLVVGGLQDDSAIVMKNKGIKNMLLAKAVREFEEIAKRKLKERIGEE